MDNNLIAEAMKRRGMQMPQQGMQPQRPQGMMPTSQQKQGMAKAPEGEGMFILKALVSKLNKI